MFINSVSLANIIRVDPDSSTNGPGSASNWSNAYHSLQAGLTAASGGDQIWVADSVFKPSVRTNVNDPRSVTFSIPSALKVFGGFEGVSRPGGGETSLAQRNPDLHESVLSGDIDNDDTLDDDNAYHVVIEDGSDITDTTILSGFTIRDGWSHEDPEYVQGAGISIRNGAWPVIARCKIVSNEGGGVGLFVDQYSEPAESDPQFLDCTFAGNIGGYHGGAVYVYSAAGGLTLVNCIGYDNYAQSTGAFIGGFGGPSTLINCTITNNECGSGSENHGAALRFTGDRGTDNVINCTLFGNLNTDGEDEGAQVDGQSTYPPNVVFCDVEGLDFFAGNNNVDVTPSFVNAGLDDFRLEYLSLLLNNGDPSVMPADTYDIDDDSDTAEPLPDRAMSDRQVNSSSCIDIGAHENQVAGSCPGDITDEFSGEPDGVVDDNDLKLVEAAWGTPGGVADVAPDDCGDGTVDTDDLLFIVNNWGSCSQYMSSEGGGLTLEQLMEMLLTDLGEHPEFDAPISALIAYLLENGL